MKPKNIKEAYKQIRNLLKKIDKIYANTMWEDWIIGDTNKDVYVQFIPTISALFYDDNGEVVEEKMATFQDLRSLKKSPKGNDWRKQLMGQHKYTCKFCDNKVNEGEEYCSKKCKLRHTIELSKVKK